MFFICFIVLRKNTFFFKLFLVGARCAPGTAGNPASGVFSLSHSGSQSPLDHTKKNPGKTSEEVRTAGFRASLSWTTLSTSPCRLVFFLHFLCFHFFLCFSLFFFSISSFGCEGLGGVGASCYLPPYTHTQLPSPFPLCTGFGGSVPLPRPPFVLSAPSIHTTPPSFTHSHPATALRDPLPFSEMCVSFVTKPVWTPQLFLCRVLPLQYVRQQHSVNHGVSGMSVRIKVRAEHWNCCGTN